jgi:response regulator RpfG family c-di-GMP phosphodiesterase
MLTPGSAQASAICLRDAGYSLSIASNGASALRLLHQLRPDLILVGPLLAEVSRDGLLDLLGADHALCRIPVIRLGDREDSRAWNTPKQEPLPPALADAYRALAAALA